MQTRSRSNPPLGRARALRRWLLTCARGEDGVVAVLFALGAALILVPLVAFTVDLGASVSQKRKLQDALDAAALFAARLPVEDAGKLDQTGRKALLADVDFFGDRSKSDQLITSKFTYDGAKVKAWAEAPAASMIGQFFQNRIRVETEIMRPGDIEVALVLDNTGSMQEQNRMPSLKKATKELIVALSTAEAKSVKVALVPFSSTVRVKPTVDLAAYKKQDPQASGVPLWIDPQALGHAAAGQEIFNSQKRDRLDLMKSIDQDWAGCVESRRPPYDITDAAPSPANVNSYFTPYFWPDEPDGIANLNSYLKDQGSENQTFEQKQQNTGKYEGNFKTDKPFTSKFKVYGQDSFGKHFYYGPNAGCVLQPVIPLRSVRTTQDQAVFNTAIDGMLEVGQTHIPIGLVWGWHVLSPNAYFGDAHKGAAYTDPNVRKFIILMTDGENTSYDLDSNNKNDSIYGGYGYIWQNVLPNLTRNSTDVQRRNAMDARLKLLCANIEASHITIFTVGVQVSEASKKVLEACAPGRYFDVKKAEDLSSTFLKIAASISELRINK